MAEWKRNSEYSADTVFREINPCFDVYLPQSNFRTAAKVQSDGASHTLGTYFQNNPKLFFEPLLFG